MEALLLLLSLGADVNSQDEKGRTGKLGLEKKKSQNCCIYYHINSNKCACTNKHPMQIFRKHPEVLKYWDT